MVRAEPRHSPECGEGKTCERKWNVSLVPQKGNQAAEAYLPHPTSISLTILSLVLKSTEACRTKDFKGMHFCNRLAYELSTVIACMHSYVGEFVVLQK